MSDDWGDLECSDTELPSSFSPSFLTLSTLYTIAEDARRSCPVPYSPSSLSSLVASYSMVRAAIVPLASSELLEEWKKAVGLYHRAWEHGIVLGMACGEKKDAVELVRELCGLVDGVTRYGDDGRGKRE